MGNAKLTLIGMYNWDNTLFDGITLPTSLTRQTLIKNILLRGGEFETIYADPDFMKQAIGAWSDKWQATFTRWTNALAIEYDPLENYDRMEDWTDNRDRAGERQEMTTEDRTEHTAEDTAGETNAITDTSNETNVSAYDAGNTYSPKDQEIGHGDDQSTTASTRNADVTENTGSNTQTTDADTEEAVHTGRIHGNIGVTTSQQMLLAELDLGYWNIYEKITDLFLTELIIPVY